ncbi:MAG: biotin transporter BioY [Clostridia bacterium]|nr:biotin transporter BioY [Clostridia bacterium]
MLYVALMAVVIAICSWITVPFTVPFTMQTFGVFAALIILGGRRGTLATALYILLGCAGVPVFSGFNAGIAYALGPTGGYMIGFLLAGLCYTALEKPGEKSRLVRYMSLALGMLLCYVLGTLWFVGVYAARGTQYGLGKALTLCVLPFILPDAAKITLAVVVGSRLKRALPLV